MCTRGDTGEYLVMEGDFVLGNKERLDGSDRYIRLCRAHVSGYLRWFGQVLARGKGV